MLSWTTIGWVLAYLLVWVFLMDIFTARFDSPTGVTNAVDDLVAIGIPNEELRVNKEKHQVQVMIADTTHSEITEVLQRHGPLELKTDKAGD